MDTYDSTRRFSILCAALAAAACLAGTAQAQSAATVDLHRLKVGYNDLDVNTVGGATTLYRRIRGAAHFVCGEEGRGLDEQAHWNSCVRTAVTQAVVSVHSPLLSALDADGAAGSMQTALLRK